jgi:hypothetical protein
MLPSFSSLVGSIIVLIAVLILIVVNVVIMSHMNGYIVRGHRSRQIRLGGILLPREAIDFSILPLATTVL